MQIRNLLGKTIERIDVDKDRTQIIFSTEDKQYKMWHAQDCCESVYIEDIVGDLEDLIGNPITLAEEMSNSSNDESLLVVPPPDEGYEESYTWTFYKLATIKGYVDFRWFGSSNGYYSEAVSMCEVGSREDY